MAGNISYYFTLFKKFQVLNHVPEQTVHGAPSSPTGNFQLNDPSSVFGGSATFPSLLGATPGASPLWQLLNAAAVGGSGPSGIPPMPLGASSSSPPSWVAFQVSAPLPIVAVFGNWITAGAINDIPNGVVNPHGGAINNVAAVNPGPLTPGVSLFVCSAANDTGVRPPSPGAFPVPSNYWATSLIYLVDPSTGNTVTPVTLNPGDEWFLVGVVGNGSNVQTGLYTNGGVAGATVNTTGVECAGVVMVWNTTFGPGVELPALSNLDVTATNPIYDVYNLFKAGYEVVGFRLNVQNVYNGIIAALVAQGPPGSGPTTPQTNLGGLTPEQWVTAQPAHLCAKILIRQAGGAFPNVGDTPLTNAALAQKNLAPFELTITDTDPNPTNIVWKNFVTGTPYFLRTPRWGPEPPAICLACARRRDQAGARRSDRNIRALLPQRARPPSRFSRNSAEEAVRQSSWPEGEALPGGRRVRTSGRGARHRVSGSTREALPRNVGRHRISAAQTEAGRCRGARSGASHGNARGEGRNPFI